jgi:hypothetical protein
VLLWRSGLSRWRKAGRGRVGRGAPSPPRPNTRAPPPPRAPAPQKWLFTPAVTPEQRKVRGTALGAPPPAGPPVLAASGRQCHLPLPRTRPRWPPPRRHQQHEGEAASPSDVDPEPFKWRPLPRSSHRFAMIGGVVHVWADEHAAQPLWQVRRVRRARGRSALGALAHFTFLSFIRPPQCLLCPATQPNPTQPPCSPHPHPPPADPRLRLRLLHRHEHHPALLQPRPRQVLLPPAPHAAGAEVQPPRCVLGGGQAAVLAVGA